MTENAIPAKTKKRLRLNAIGIMGFVLYASMLGVTWMKLGVPQAPIIAGQIIGAVLAAALFGGIVWLLSFRNLMLANLAMTFVLVLSAVFAYRQAATSATNAADAQINEAVLYAGKLLEDPAVRYREAREALIEAGGIDPASMPDRLAVSARIEMVEDYQRATKQLSESIQRLDGAVRAQLIAAGNNRAEAMQETREHLNGPYAKIWPQICREDRECVMSALKVLNLLHERWGHWQYDTANGTISFDETDDQGAYDVGVEWYERATTVRQNLLDRLNGKVSAAYQALAQD